MSAVRPPSAGDLLICARSLGWPQLSVGAIEIAAGEDAWRARLATLTDAERLEIWTSGAWPQE